VIALITGASGGIGADITRELAARKYDVILVARSTDTLNQLAEEVTRAHGVRTHVVTADLAASGAAESVAARAHEISPRLDALVNNAGYGLFGRFTETNLADEMNMIRVNVEALTELTKRLLPDILAARGRIMNVSSTAAFQPGPLMAVYYATKAYVLSLSEALAEELAPAGVTVTALCPGPTRSGFQTRADADTSAKLYAAGLMSSDAVAKRGVEGMLKGRRVVVPGGMNWLGVQSTRIAPRRLLTKVVRWLHE
jgi:hypothetical protein